MKNRLCIAFLTVASCTTVAAEVYFSDLTINDASTVLYNAEVEAPEYRSYLSAFVVDLDETATNRVPTQLTFFPEQVSYLPNSEQLQIQNQFGLFRSNADLEDIKPVEAYPSFIKGADIITAKINPVNLSPDGRYMIHFEESSAALGNLVLTSFVDNSITVISNNVELQLDQLPIKWSPESDFFVYEKNGELYYFSISQYESGRLLNENFRTIGKGQMANIRWGRGNELYYLSGTLIYQILGVEFFTRSIYQEFLRIGRIIGKIPFPFDPNFDRFWISPDSSRVLLDKGGRNIYLYPLQTNEYSGASLTIELPYLYLPINVHVEKVLWNSSGILTLMVDGTFGEANNSKLYRLDLSQQKDIYNFEPLHAPEFEDIIFGPNEEYAALLTPNYAMIYDYTSWKPTRRIRHNNLYHFIFINNDEVLLAGGDIVETFNLVTNTQKFVTFSRSDSIGFNRVNGEILVQTGDRIQAYDVASGRWFKRSSFTNTPTSLITNDYRIYLENLSAGRYKNMIMVRQVNNTANSPRTTSLFNRPARSYEPFPDSDEAVNLTNFSHGSRIRQREVALVFNAINSVVGLNEVLRTLEAYNVEATFFLNGDFIRHYPGAVQEIANSKHEVGSLFNIYFDLSDSRFEVTRSFIRQGLINNEDEYFKVTGDELGLLWHAPYYYVNSEILAATENANYTYVGRDVDSLDWVPTYNDGGTSRLYFPSAQLIERIVEQKQPGSIISMTVGTTDDDRPNGGRADYLFQDLDILINALLKQGYSIVPVSTLIDHAE